MKKRKIGSLEVSVVGLGCNNFGTGFFGTDTDAASAKRIIDAALDSGINFLDTAEEYSTRTKWSDGQSEQFVGAALKGKRNDVVIASKFGVDSLDNPDERGRSRIISAVEGSLKRLGTDRIDLYQQHFPDPNTPIDAVQRHGLMLLPFFPLASGLLTGKYRKGESRPEGTRFGGDTFVASVLRDGQLTDARIEKVEKLQSFATERGHSIVELAFSWLVSQPFVASVIAGATKPEQIKANAAAANWELTADDFKTVAAIMAGEKAPA